MRAIRVPSASEPKLEMVEADIPEPVAGSVRIRVEACGICHSDSLTVHNSFPGISFPRAPGHEIAGTIDALGANVTTFKVGERVGVGWHGGHDGTCAHCRRGDFLACKNGEIPGMQYDGGYSEYVIAPIGALARIPDELSSVDAAPLMCAGITMFNSLRNSGARAGDTVAVLGIGGLGHLGVQYANKMGFRTVAIARGKDKEALARKLGAHHYIDSQAGDIGAELQKLGGARIVLSTVTSAKAMEPALGGLGLNGRLIVVGADFAPMTVPSASMIGSRTGMYGWPSGTCVDSEDTMNFSVLTGVRPTIETMPLERAQEAYDRMMSGAARFRMVLTLT